MRRLRTQPITPGEARYVLERLLADRRITASDVENGLQALQDEIVELEARIRALSAAAGNENHGKQRTAGTRVRTAAGRLGLRFAGLIRHLPKKVRADLKRLRIERGVEAAIAAAEAAAGAR
jgi:hypothetical protein